MDIYTRDWTIGVFMQDKYCEDMRNWSMSDNLNRVDYLSKNDVCMFLAVL